MTEITWFKLFHDFADDAKFLRAAEIAGTTVELAQACFARAMCRASSNPDRGSLAGVDFEEFAWWFSKPVELIRSLFAAFEKVSRMIKDGRLANWAKRQGAAAAKLAEAVSPGAVRTRRWRQKKKRDRRQQEMLFAFTGGAAFPVTSDGSRPSHASPGPSPSAGDRDLESDFTLSEESDARARARRSFASGDFAKFLEVYPHKVDLVLARAAFAEAVRNGAGIEEILAGVRRYCATKPADREWMNPANFLKRKRWEDQPASARTTIEIADDDEPFFYTDREAFWARDWDEYPHLRPENMTREEYLRPYREADERERQKQAEYLAEHEDAA